MPVLLWKQTGEEGDHHVPTSEGEGADHDHHETDLCDWEEEAEYSSSYWPLPVDDLPPVFHRASRQSRR